MDERVDTARGGPQRAAGADRRSAAGLVAWLILCYGAAALGARFLPGAWYAALAKPVWTPPNWLFAPVWTVLYGMMAVAAWLVWRRYGFSGARGALALFLVQLGLNGAWSWIFFGLQRAGFALADIVALWTVLLLATLAFWKRRRSAAVLLVPYLAWVTFAVALNLEIWRLNR